MKFSVTCIMTAMLMSVAPADVVRASGRGDEFGAEFDGLESRSWYRETTTSNSDSDRDFFSRLRVKSAGQTLKRQVSQIELNAGSSSNLPTFRQRYNETSTTRSNPDLQRERAVEVSL